MCSHVGKIESLILIVGVFMAKLDSGRKASLIERGGVF